MSKIRILIADDHAVLRAGLRLLLTAQPDMEVCGEAADGHEAILRVRELRPDVVIMDLRMPGLEGIEATRRITGAHPGVKVLVLSMYDEVSYLDRVLAAGAAGYALKSAADTELLAAVRAVRNGEVFLDPSFTRVVVERYVSGDSAATAPSHDVLTAREVEVLRLLALGHTSREVANQVGLSSKTVETYKARIEDKLGLHGRVALVRYALREGLLADES